MTAALNANQVKTLKIALAGRIKWTGATPQTLRGVSRAGLIDLSPENETTYRSVSGLERRGFLRHGGGADDDVAWEITTHGRAALAKAMQP